MDDKNKLFTVALVALASVVGGLGVVFSIGMTVQAAMAPMTGYLREIADGQKKMEAAFTRAAQGDTAALEARLAALEKEILTLKNQQPRAAEMPPPEDMNKVYDLPVADSVILGSKDAPVSITVFEDYQCPYCGKSYPALIEAQKAFPDKVRIVLKHFPLPFHGMARSSAKAAIAAGEQGRFYEMSELLFANASALSNDKIKELAGKAGLNVDKFLKDLKDKDADYEKKIAADMALAGKSDVRGTPTYFLNGKKNAARTVEAWKAEIKALLQK